MASEKVLYKAKDGTLINLSTKVINNTTTDSTTDALSAAQGKVLASKFTTLTKSSVGLGNVDNTADANKSVKAATKLQTYQAGSTTNTYGDNYPLYAQWDDNIVNLKVDNYKVKTDSATNADKASTASKVANAITIQTNGSTAATYDGSSAKTVNVTKSSIGLGNVDNTADSEKSVKYATGAGSANAVAWGNVTGKPSTFTPAAHVHDHLERVEDTRSTTTKPSDYKNGFKFIGIKTLKAAGISASESEYCCLIGMNGWTDKSGGGATEIAIDISGRMFYRHQNMNSENDSFDTWRLVLTSDYVVDSLTTNYPNMPLSAHMGFELANRIYDLDKSTLGKTDIVDNLNDTSTDKVLSANQGKVLNETKVNQPIYSTTDLTPGVSDLADGQIYVVYYN